jgi:sugar phosphate isomerase/epimerase
MCRTVVGVMKLQGYRGCASIQCMTRQVVLSSFSLGLAPVPFEVRLEAAAAAGFDGIGMYVGHYLSLRDDGWTDRQLQDAVAAAGVGVPELEVLPFFDDDRAEILLHMAEVFGALRCQVVAPFYDPFDWDAAVVWLRAMGERMAEFGTRLSLEFVGCSTLGDAPTTERLVHEVGLDVAGICVDTWHVFRGAGLASLEQLDPAAVAALQFDDGPMVPVVDDYIQDCLHYRQAPGEGQFDLDGFLSLMPRDAPVSVEVISDELSLVPSIELAAHLFDTTKAVLDRQQ